MRIEEQSHGAVVILKPAGPLTGDACAELKTHIANVHQRTLGRFVIDATGVPFVDSDGLEVLLEATEQLIKSGRILKMCCANDTIRDSLDLTGIMSSFEHYDDLNN